MRIIEGGIKNWCQHEDLEFDSNCPVVGLFADNGDGKSNFLAAIKYLLTSELTLAKERYIRNYNPDAVDEDGKKPKWFAHAWCRFQQGGMEGRIERRITPTTSSRKLLWDGKEYTKAAEVDSMLEDILGADKKAVSSAVFIAQGELEKLLFGNLSDREKLFIKFLNLGHLSKVAGAAESRAKLLMSQVDDLSAQKDEIMLSIQAAARASDEERKKLDEIPDFSPILSRMRCLSADLASISRERASIQQDRSKLANEQQALKTYLAQEGVDSGEAVATKLKETEALGKKLADDLDGLREAQKANERIAARRNALEALTSSRQELVEANKMRPKEDYDKLRAEESKLDRLLDLADTKGKKEERLGVVQAQLAEMKGSEVKPTEDLEKEIEQLASERHTEQEHLKVLEAAASGNSEEGSCPVCGSEIAEHLLSEDNLKKIQEGIIASGEVLAAKRTELLELRETNHGIENTLRTLNAEVAEITEELKVIDEELQDRDKAKMLERVDLVQKHIAAHDEADKKVGNLPGIIEAREATYQNCSNAVEAEDEQKAKLHNASVLPVYEKQIETEREKYQHLYSVYNRILGIEEKIADLLTELQTAEKKLEAMEERSDKEISAFDEEVSDRLVADIDALPTIIAEYESKQSTRDTQAGIVSAREESLREAKGRLAELEDRESKDAARRGVAEMMQRFKDMFSRTGLPKTFIRYRFDQLASLTQENLAAMEANFSVFPSDEAELSFDFVRVDDGSDYVMHQDQLSGGQRVSLSIAFLLAVQQLVVPDIGFLVLDEPSLHLDEKSRNDLKDLLVGLSEQLRNSEAQVFVVDHSPDLRPAFQRLIELKK